MIGMPKGVRRLCAAYHIEAYSGHGPRRELAAQGQLVGLLNYAFREAGLAAGSYQVQVQGGSGLAMLPTGEGVDEPRLLVQLIRAFETGLAENNENLLPDRRLRLRLALHQGVVHEASHGYVGSAVTEACRIRDSDAIRDALARSTGYLVVAVADGLYRDVLADGPYGLPRAFRQVRSEAKEYSADAWIYLPGATEPAVSAAPGPAQDSAGDQREQGTVPGQPESGDSHSSASGLRTTLVQRNDVSGGQLIGAQGGSVYIDSSVDALAPPLDRGHTRAADATQMTFDGDLAKLAETAAVALVTAMGTSGWTGIRDATATVFRRAGGVRHAAIGDRLDDDAALVSAAGQQAEARAAAQLIWRLKFTDLLSVAPGRAAEIAGIIRTVNDAATTERGTQHMEQHNIVRDLGQAFVAQGGNVIVHGESTVPREEAGSP